MARVCGMRAGSVLTHPLIFPLLFVAFIIVGSIASYCMDDLGHTVSLQMGALVAIGLAAYVVGTRYEIPLGPDALLAVAVVLTAVMTAREHGIMIVPTCIALVLLHRYWHVVSAHAVQIALIGMALLLANLAYIGYIPALNPELRHASQTLPFVFGYGLAFLGGVLHFPEHRYGGFGLSVAVIGLVALYGMRSYLLIFILALCIEALMLGVMSVRTAVVIAIAAFATVVGMGYFTTYLLPQEWHLSGLELVAYRVGFTTHMLDEACRMAGWTGILHGELWLSSATSPIIGEIVAGSGNITTTALGPLIVDGGVLELPVMAVAGSVSATIYRRAKASEACIPYYALVLSILILSIEISPIPILFAFLLYALAVVEREGMAQYAEAGRQPLQKE